MHVLFISNEYPPYSGGIGVHVSTLARTLVEKGHRASVMGIHSEAVTFEDEGVQVRFLARLGWPKVGWIADRVRLWRAVRQRVQDEDVDVVEAPDFDGLSAGFRLSCPLVVRCHGSATYFDHILGRTTAPLRRLRERWALHGADHVAGVSRFATRETARLFGLDEEHVCSIPNGIDASQFRPAFAYDGDENAGEDPSILYFGSLIRKKGVLDLCEAFTDVVRRCPAARLRLMGRDLADSETGASSTWALCRERLSPEAQRQTTYLGTRPYHEVHEEVRRASVCAFPSYAEAMPLSWLEAMACARPIVAYDVGWAPEVVVHEKTGLLVPAGDIEALGEALARLLAGDHSSTEMGRAARRRVEQSFSAAAVTERSLKWYRRVVV